MTRPLAALALGIALGLAARAEARDSVRNFPAPGTCPIHLGWPIDGSGNPITTAPPRVRPELVFTAAKTQAAITFTACDDRTYYDRVAATDTGARLSLTIDDLAVVRKDVYDANQVAASVNGCYASQPADLVRSVFNPAAAAPFTAQEPFRDTFDGAPQRWALGTATIGLFSPDGSAANRNPTGRRLVLARQTRPDLDDMEAPQDFQLGPDGSWFLDGSQGHSGTQSWTVPDFASVTDSRLTTSSVQFVAAGEELSFWHRYETEFRFDGAVLEYSTDSGFNWFDVLAGNGAGIPANPGRFLQNGYSSSLIGQNPITGRNAWTGTSGGYQLVRVSLADFVGWPVTWRWRFTTDVSQAGVGWSVDDATIAMPGTACSSARVQVHNLVPGTTYVVDFKWDVQGFSAGENVLDTFIDTAPALQVPSADLVITNTDGVASAVPGQQVVYTITAAHGGGPTNAPGAKVTDAFPAALACTWTCAGAGGGTCAASGSGNIDDTVNLPVGASVTYTAACTIAPGAVGTLSNTATVAVPAGVTDPTAANNSATDVDTLTPQANVGITKTDGVTSAVPGQSVTYAIVATNAGPSNAPTATVADTFPAGLACTWTCQGTLGGTCPASGAGTINNVVVGLPSGASVAFSAACSLAASATGTLSNTATVAAGAGVTDPAPGNNTATDTDTVTPRADLAITKTDGVGTAVPGQTVTYSVVATNAGPSNAPGSTVADTLPAALTCTWTCAGAGGGTCAASGSGNVNASVGLPAGASVTYTLSCAIAPGAAGLLANTATVNVAAGVTDPVAGNNSATDTDTLTPRADLAITKTDGVALVAPGQAVSYVIVASNSGPSAAPGALVEDTMPPSLQNPTWTCSGAGGGGCTASGTGNIARTVTLPKGASVTFTVSGTVGASPGRLRNTTSVTPPSGTTDPSMANNSATDEDILRCASELALLGDGRSVRASLAPGGTAWFAAFLTAGSSYTAEFANVLDRGATPGLTTLSGDDGCAAVPTVQVRDTASVEPAAAATARVSFIAAGDPPYRFRVTNGSAQTLVFSAQVAETTMFSPAWSTGGTYNTYYSLQNTSGADIAGRLKLLGAAGETVAEGVLTIPAGRTVGANTSSLGAPAGAAGAAVFTYDGPPGSILLNAAIANFASVPAYIQPVKFEPTRAGR